MNVLDVISQFIILTLILCNSIYESDCPRVENGLDFENNNISDLEIDSYDNVYDFDATQEDTILEQVLTEPSHFYRLRIKIHLRSVEDKIEGIGKIFISISNQY